MKSSRSGFTLIELLIVIAIIGVLSVIVAAQLGKARERARDAQRISDIHQIQLALEANFEAGESRSQEYPDRDNLGDLVTDGYLPSIPIDPSTGQRYAYNPIDNGFGLNKSYCLGATLENPNHSAIATSANCDTNGDGDTNDSTNYEVSR